jgi:hypothetical protein
MSEPGITTDQSRIRPSRRANLPLQVSLEVLRGKPRFARLRRIFLSWRNAPAAERTVDYTSLEGDPTLRADTGLPIDRRKKTSP